MVVAVDGTNFSQTTQKDGKFSFPNIPLGSYSLTLSFPKNSNFNPYTYRYDVLSFPNISGTRNINTIDYCAISSTIINKDLSVVKSGPYSIGGDSTYTITGTISQKQVSENQRWVRIFLGLDSTVSSANYLNCANLYIANAFYSISKDSSVFHAIVDPSSFIEAGCLQKGKDTKLYAVAYGSSFGETGYYFHFKDPATGLYVYPGLNPKKSNVVSFILP